MPIFLTVLRYIYQTPVKAGLTKDIAALPNASPKIQKEVSKYVKVIGWKLFKVAIQAHWIYRQ